MIMEQEKKLPEGLYDKYSLIDNCINILANLRITIKDLADVGNPVIDVINKLAKLSEGLREDDRRLKEAENDGSHNASFGENV